MTAPRKETVKWSIISGILLSAMGFFGTKTYEHIDSKFDKIDSLEREQISIKEKASSDKAQWELIREQGLKIQALEVENRVLRRQFESVGKNQIIEVKMNISDGQQKFAQLEERILEPELRELKVPEPVEEIKQIEQIYEQFQMEEPIDKYEQRQIQRFKK